MKWDRALYGDAVLPQTTLERMWRIDAIATASGAVPLRLRLGE